MPIYVDALTVPAGTSKNNPAVLEIEVEEYTITGYEVFFPPGCHGQVYIAIYYGSEQLAPKPAGAALRGDWETVSWPEEWRVPERPCTIEFRGWSPLATYDHTVLCRVITRPIEQEGWVREQRESQSLIVKFLKRIIGVR